MRFFPYKRYKKSGAEWPSEVPEHWEVCALKRVAVLQSGDAISSESIEETGEFPVFGGERFTRVYHFLYT